MFPVEQNTSEHTHTRSIHKYKPGSQEVVRRLIVSHRSCALECRFISNTPISCYDALKDLLEWFLIHVLLVIIISFAEELALCCAVGKQGALDRNGKQDVKWASLAVCANSGMAEVAGPSSETITETVQTGTPPPPQQVTEHHPHPHPHRYHLALREAVV